MAESKDIDLKEEQERTLATPRLKSSIILWFLFFGFDLVYGWKRTLPKFKVLELLARYPYWAWEDWAYKRLSRLYARAGKVKDGRTKEYLALIEFGREAQDNEQWHLLLLEDAIRQKGIKLGWIRHWLLPRLMAWQYYHFSRLLFRLRPVWSFAMNAAFESHAEHQYMLMAKEHPEWDEESFESVHYEHYPRQKTFGDLIRRIGLDEREHMNRSLAEVKRLRTK